MGKSLTYIAAGIAGALVLTAAFMPGRQTVGGIQAAGTSGRNLFKGAEGL